MSPPEEIGTDRLRLRRWRRDDRAAFAAINQDSRVMEHFPAVLTCDESDEAKSIEGSRHHEHRADRAIRSKPGIASRFSRTRVANRMIISSHHFRLKL